MANIIIIGAGVGGTSILKALIGIADISIKGICDTNQNASGILLARDMKIPVYSDIIDILNQPSVDIIIEATGSTKVEEIIHANKMDYSVIIHSKAADLMMTIVESREKMLQSLYKEAEQLANMSNNLATNVHSISQLVQNTINSAKYAADQVKDLVDFSNKAAGNLQEINEVLQIITSTAKQTKLLAFNAAIEAARSGEHGKGFSVVADEVRKLADFNTASAQKVASILRNIEQSVSTINAGINETGATIQTQSEYMQNIAGNIEHLEAMSDELSESVNNLISMA